MKVLKSKLSDFFKWVKGTELVELDNIDALVISVICDLPCVKFQSSHVSIVPNKRLLL